MRFWPSPCSEFPNDNPELHDGCVWLCSTQRARPKPVVRAHHVAAAQHDAARDDTAQHDVARCAAAVESTPPESAPVPRPELVPPPSGDAPLSLAELLPSVSGEIPVALAELLPFAREESAEVRAGLELREATAQEAFAPSTSVPSAVTVSAVAPSPERADSDTLIESLDPFVAELYSLVAPLREAASTATSVEAAPLAEPALPAELPVEPIEPSDMNTALTIPSDEPLDPDAWESQWSLTELHARCEREEREIHELEREVSELRELRAAERSEPVLTVPAPPPDEPSVVLEPLTLEDFLGGGSLQVPENPEPPPTLRGLPPIELELEPLPAESRAWDEIVSAVSRDLLRRNAVRAAVLLPRIVEGEPMRLDRLPGTQKECLLLEGIAELQESQLVLSAEFMRRARRLRQAFIGGRLDAPTLTNWLASIVRALLASPSDQQTILSEWRDVGLIDVIERAA